MTLVLTAINAACVVQASDRLTTKWRAQRFLGEHDAIANKTIIYLAYDGPMVISFSGTAYVGDEPTDNWIARQLAGNDFIRMPDERIMSISFQRLPIRTINQACWLLQQAINAEVAFNSSVLKLAIGGWRIRLRRLVQILLEVVKTKNSAQRQGHMKMQNTGYNTSFCFTGVDFSFDDLKTAMMAHSDQRTLLANPEMLSAFLREMIVRTSRSNQAVGSDVVSVEIPRWQPEGPRRVIIRYRPETERYSALLQDAGPAIPFPAAFWPWIVTPMGVRAPTVSTGGRGMIGHLCGWEFVHEAPSVAAPRGLFFAESSIERPKPPS